jgi:hypothetical protein
MSSAWVAVSSLSSTKFTGYLLKYFVALTPTILLILLTLGMKNTRSNMTKACSTQEEADKTIQHYQNKDGTEAFHKKINGKWNVYRKSDNKSLKSVNYSPADLKSIVKPAPPLRSPAPQTPQ